MCVGQMQFVVAPTMLQLVLVHLASMETLHLNKDVLGYLIFVKVLKIVQVNMSVSLGSVNVNALNRIIVLKENAVRMVSV